MDVSVPKNLVRPAFEYSSSYLTDFVIITPGGRWPERRVREMKDVTVSVTGTVSGVNDGQPSSAIQQKEYCVYR